MQRRLEEQLELGQGEGRTSEFQLLSLLLDEQLAHEWPASCQGKGQICQAIFPGVGARLGHGGLLGLGSHDSFQGFRFRNDSVFP